VDRETFARQRMAALPFDELVVDGVEALAVDGLEGLLLLAEARDPRGPVFVLGVFLFEPTNYWIGVGIAPVDQRASASSRFRQVAASFERE
jgi:hypothetical protein